MRGKDRELEKILRDIALFINKNIFENEDELPSEDNVPFDDLLDILFNTEREEAYDELCTIFPADKVAYSYLNSCLNEIREKPVGKAYQKNVTVDERQLFALKSEVKSYIKDIVGEVLHIKEMPPGSVLVDIPAQRTSKKEEFAKFALVDSKGYGRHIGIIWDSIEKYFEESINIIRIFIRKDIIKVDREMKHKVKSTIIEKLS